MRGHESATWTLALSPGAAEAVVAGLDAAGLERARDDAEGCRKDYLLRDEFRYWIDLRVHLAPARYLEIRIALTNDPWSIRAPLERALTPLMPELAGQPLRDVDGNDVAIAGAEGWWLALEDDYGRRRDYFTTRCGDYTAPISADHVYMFLHQTRWNEDNDAELAWHREREIARIEEMWDTRSPGTGQGDVPQPDA
jgi:hypothetical protein